MPHADLTEASSSLALVRRRSSSSILVSSSPFLAHFRPRPRPRPRPRSTNLPQIRLPRLRRDIIDVHISYVSGRRRLLGVALACSCQNPSVSGRPACPRCRRAAAYTSPAGAAGADLSIAESSSAASVPTHPACHHTRLDTSIPYPLSHNRRVCRPCYDSNQVLHDSNAPIATENLLVDPTTQPQMSCPKFLLSAKPNPQWIQIRQSWLRRR